MDHLDNSSVYSRNSAEQNNQFDDLFIKEKPELLDWLWEVEEQGTELYIAIKAQNYPMVQRLLTECNIKITHELTSLVSETTPNNILRLLSEHAILQGKSAIAHLIYEKIIQQNFYYEVKKQKFPSIKKALTEHNAKITDTLTALVSEKTPTNILELLWNHAKLQEKTEIALLIHEKIVQKHFYYAVESQNISEINTLLTRYNAKITNTLVSLVSEKTPTNILRLLSTHAKMQKNNEIVHLIHEKIVQKHFYYAVKKGTLSSADTLLTQYNAKITDQVELLVSGSLPTDILSLLVEHAITQRNCKNAERIYLKLVNKEVIEKDSINIHSDLFIKLVESFGNDIQLLPSFIKCNYSEYCADYIEILTTYCDRTYKAYHETEYFKYKTEIETLHTRYVEVACALCKDSAQESVLRQRYDLFATNSLTDVPDIAYPMSSLRI